MDGVTKMSVLLFLQVWLMWTDKANEKQEKSIRQLAQEARQGNAHDENVLTYYRYSQTKTAIHFKSHKNPTDFCKVIQEYDEKKQS